MAVHIKCSRPYNIEALKAIIERCGGRGPSPPRCPPMGQASDLSTRRPILYSSNSPCSPSTSSPCCKPLVPCASPRRCCPPPPSACSGPCMNCPPMMPVPPCPPCPFICPTCTGYPCVTSAPLPKPVPAPYEPPRPVVRTLMNSGGLFYTATRVCYPCPPPISSPMCLPYTPIPGMSVSC